MSKKQEDEIVITIKANGDSYLLYTEAISILKLGNVNVRRASHVEFDNNAQEWVITLPNGKEISRRKMRSDALKAEARYLNQKIYDETIEDIFL